MVEDRGQCVVVDVPALFASSSLLYSIFLLAAAGLKVHRSLTRSRYVVVQFGKEPICQPHLRALSNHVDRLLVLSSSPSILTTLCIDPR